jgi:nitroreductase
MDAYEALLTRRSVRKYTHQSINHSLIEEIMQSAMQAPSAHNRQPWEFIIIDDKNLLDKISTLHPYAQMAKEAPLAILVCGNTQIEQNHSFIAQTCAAAMQNILLALHAKGLGGVWCGIYDNPERMQVFSKLLQIPSYILPIGLVVCGYPNEKKEIESRYTTKKIHQNHW